jgi:hypothetical protein
MEQYRITLGGWPAFSEERGVNKKEVPEMFDWLPAIETTIYGHSERYYFEDCRGALDRVGGSREWLKAHEGNFSSESGDIFWKLLGEMTREHSGATASAVLCAYRNLLNDWDGHVYADKRRRALLSYRAQQPPADHLESLIASCRAYDAQPDPYLEHEIKYYCALMCISGCVTELRVTMEYALEELRDSPLEDSPPASAIHYPLLPLGAHLLPPDFQAHIKAWNLEMTKKCGDWLGEERKKYKKLYPESWAEFRDENRRLTELYADAVEELKAYQALHSIQPD